MNRTRSITRVQPVRRALAAAAVASLLGAGLAACGDKNGDGASAAPTSSGSSSAASGPASSGNAPVAAPEAGQKVTSAAFVSTVKDGLAASTTAHMTMSMALGPMGRIDATGEIDYTADPAAMAMTMTLPMAGGKPADLRFVDGILYLSMGEATGGKFWKIDPSDPSGPLAGAGIGQMVDQMDPAKALTELASGIDSVTYVGQEDVKGRQLDHYRMAVSSAALKKSMAGVGASGSDLPKTVDYDVWLDDQHRFAQMTMRLPVAGSEASVRMALTDWGGDVHIAAPPADDVTDPSRISG